MTGTRLREALRQTFGFDSFRPGQEALVGSILDGRDLLAVMPTGAGKSLCYQLPAVMAPATTIVVSPLVALMRDQVAALERLGIASGALCSANTADENRQIAGAYAAGRLKLLYLAPERLALPGTLELLRRTRVQRLAIDEAHCVSQWGHDFRPDYLRIREVADGLGGADGLGAMQLIAFTATADPGTRDEIARRLFRGQPEIIVHGFDRPNLGIAMEPKREVRRQLALFIQAHPGDSGIVYAATRKKTEELAAGLVKDGIQAMAYHAGLDTQLRSRRQERLQREDGLVMVATIAFGMGIDKPDVRFVAHADMPKSVEAHYQEIGRAGRDGLPAETLTLYGLDDIRLRRMQIEQSDGSAEFKRIEQQRLAALVALMETPRCRWRMIRSYFGEASEPCGRCDVCRHGITAADATTEARMVLSAILRTDQRFGTEHLIDVLTGHATEKVGRFGHDKLPTYGIGKARSRDAWRGVFRQLYGGGLISTELGGHGSWAMEARARPLLKGEEGFEVRADIFAARKPLKRGGGSTRVDLDLDEAERGLFQRLRDRRREIALAEEVPAYVVFPDRTLKEMARARPDSLDAFAAISGVGEAKLKRYGEAFLAVIEAAS